MPPFAPFRYLERRMTSLAHYAFTAQLPAAQLRLHSRQTMIALSHLIEELAIEGGPGTVLIATFQRLSLYLRELERYRRIAPSIAETVVAGVADCATPPVEGVRVVALEPSWALVQEWVVIARGPRCSLALMARDAEGFDPQRRSRRFLGLWTTDPARIDAAAAAFASASGVQLPTFARDSQATVQTTLRAQRALAQQLRMRP
jgi:DICT domain-containing protein